MSKETSFAPILGSNPRILVLGSLPGKESLRQQQYYAHPRNLFWKLLAEVFNSNVPDGYEEKKRFLTEHGIALWDVCHQAHRKSSLDSDIKNEVPNKISKLVDENPTIRLIAFNGQKSETLYSRYFERLDGIEFVTLLSSSPANASFTFRQKVENWKQILI